MVEKLNPVIISGHQPAYLPWLGYFHKILVSDVFIYMDDVQFIERGFIHRNKIKTGIDRELLLTIPIKKEDKKKPIKNVQPANQLWQKKHFDSIYYTYKNSKYYSEYSEAIEEIYLGKSYDYISDFIYHMLTDLFVRVLGINTQIVKGSEESFTKKKSDLILEHCKKFGADIVFLGSLGKNYINVEDFEKNKISVVFQEYIHPVYPQMYNGFIPFMSIFDLMFNVGKKDLRNTILDNNIRKKDLIYEFESGNQNQ